jgi:hypothetical protein
VKEPNQRRSKLARYIEWTSRGRTGRLAYVLSERNLPQPITGAEWQLDSRFNAAEELLREPSLRHVIKAAIEKGVEIVTMRG